MDKPLVTFIFDILWETRQKIRVAVIYNLHQLASPLTYLNWCIKSVFNVTEYLLHHLILVQHHCIIALIFLFV